MEIEKGQTFDGLSLEFIEINGIKCDLWVGQNPQDLCFNINSECAVFSQEDIQALLPYLQSFAETGTLGPTPTLQGENETQEKRIEAFVETTARQDREIKMLEIEKAYYMRQVDQQVDHIANLEELVEKWRDFGQSSDTAKTSDQLLAETSQLLGE